MSGLELPDLAELDALRVEATRDLVLIESIEVEGPAALRDEVKTRVLRRYRGRELSSRDITALRDELTANLIKAGYITSGARIPRQTLENATLRVELVPGRLETVVVEGARQFDADRLASRIHGTADGPLNLKRLERRLQWIASEPLIARLSARLEPGLNPGEAILRVELVEHPPQRLQLLLANDVVPSIGSEHMRLVVGHDNLLGWRDSFEAYVGKTPGLDEWKVRYELPFNRFDTRIFASYRDSQSQVVHSNLDLDLIRLESRSRTLSLGIEQPFRLGRRTELLLSVRGDLRRAQSRVNDFGFFLTPGEDEEGRVRASVLRVVQGLTARRTNWVVSARSTLSIGIDVFRASDGDIGRGSTTPDGTFFSWLGQMYGAWRLPPRFGRLQLAARADVQIANDPMLAMERFAIGGQRTVRGYAENTLVRDNGAVAALELRIPLLRERTDGWSLHLVPFVDGGLAWNEGPAKKREWLASMGLGVKSAWRENFRFGMEWGGRLLDGGDAPDRALQKHGFHIVVEMGL
ncbi:MAG: ShlB/FhaC/HecB family hemolysin secretion/activation protein [Myxococcota bacterium]|nr:ShlB/FhaC/HecB family hemolysin secretion/activation protein [Myxococcota bacterium]